MRRIVTATPIPRGLPLAAAFLTALLAVLAPQLAHAGFECTVCTPVVPVPAARYEPDGALKPGPILGDTTWYEFNYEPSHNEPFWFDLDIESGVLFTATGSTMEIWDMSNPGEPSRLTSVRYPTLGQWKKSDKDFYVTHVDAPPGNPNMAAVSIEGGMGISILDTSNPTRPAVMYQDEGTSTYGSTINGADVYAAKIGGRHYAFLASDRADVYLYDMDAAMALNSPCYAEDGCGTNVALKKLEQVKARLIDGAGQYLVIPKGSTGVEVWNVANPTAPSLTASFAGNYAYDADMWNHSGVYKVAVASIDKTYIYDLSCLANGCPSTGKTLDTPDSETVRHSFDGTTHYLYVGNNNGFSGGVQREYLFDLTAANPEEITPQVHPDGYWGWYYGPNPTGFRRVTPYRAEVYQGHMVRAGFSVLDVHERVGISAPPLADFNWEAQSGSEEIYPNDPVDFTDLSTGGASEWLWGFEGGSPSQSTDRNPTGVTFAQKGDWDISLTASNSFGMSAPKVRTLTVLDPNPVIGAVTANVAVAPVCSTVTFTGHDVTGKPPLTWSWQIWEAASKTDDGTPQNGQPTNLPGATSQPSYAWEVPSDLAPGLYYARLEVDGVATSEPASSKVVDIQALDDLTFLDGSGEPVAEADYEPSASAVDFGAVTFGVAAQGATRWVWDFGDDRCPAGFNPLADGSCETTDPNLGEAPTHQYVEAFQTYQVTVSVENCNEGPISASTTVETGEIEPLDAAFSAEGICFGLFGCGASVDQKIFFKNLTTGDPDRYEVDWNGTGNFVPETPVSGKFSHTYTAVSSAGYKPVLRAFRGNQTSDYEHDAIVISPKTTPPPPEPPSPPPPPPPPPPSPTGLDAQFTVSPSAPEVGQEITLDGSASTGTPTAWVWTFPGGTVKFGKTLKHTFSSPGAKQVKLEVSKPGDSCPNGLCTDTAQKTLNVTEADDGPDDPGGPRPAPEGNGCSGDAADDADKLCLLGGRFQVQVRFDHPDAGMKDAGSIWYANRTGFFWFFNPLNVELIVKVLDGRPVNGKYWVFFGSLTNRFYEVTVTDTETGESKMFESQPYLRQAVCGQQLTDAFEPSDSVAEGSTFIAAADTGGLFARYSFAPVSGNTMSFDASASSGSPETFLWQFGDGNQAFGEQVEHTFPGPGTYSVTLEVSKEDDSCLFGFCSHATTKQVTTGDSGGETEDPGDPNPNPGETTKVLRLLDNRFEVRVDFKFVNGSTGEVTEGQANAVEGTDQSGFFWFNRSDNLELTVKMVNASNEERQQFWVFYGGLTTFEYTLTVEDTLTGVTREYYKAQGEYCGGADTGAFLYE